ALHLPTQNDPYPKFAWHVLSRTYPYCIYSKVNPKISPSNYAGWNIRPLADSCAAFSPILFRNVWQLFRPIFYSWRAFSSLLFLHHDLHLPIPLEWFSFVDARNIHAVADSCPFEHGTVYRF